jgi:hypothetical protein
VGRGRADSAGSLRLPTHGGERLREQLRHLLRGRPRGPDPTPHPQRRGDPEIVEGTADVEVGEEVARFSAEALAVVPALVPHALANVGETTLRVVGFFSSAAAIHAYEDTIMPLGANVLVTPPPQVMGSALA